MPEIKIKHIVSFSSEDKVFKAENLLKPETYRKWKCATAGEKKVTAILQLEKATKIHSIDIGNEHSAFVEVLVARSGEQNYDFKDLLVASSFMTPMESRNGTNVNRVRMFGPDKLSQNLKEEKWDVVQIVCTQPFNKTVQYGLTFMKLFSPPEAAPGTDQSFGAFKLKNESEEDKSVSVGKWFLKQKESAEIISPTSPSVIRQASSFAAATLASNESVLKSPPSTSPSVKRKHDDDSSTQTPPPKKKDTATVNKDKVGYKDILKNSPPQKALSKPSESKSPFAAVPKKNTVKPEKKEEVKPKMEEKKKKMDLHEIMKRVVFVISGFQNPERSDIREYAVEMGAKYKADWDSSCTHLICAFVNTPKYLQVQKKGGRIVSKHWVIDCYKKRDHLPWRKYMLGKYTKSETSSDEESAVETDEDVPNPPKPKAKLAPPQPKAKLTPPQPKAKLTPPQINGKKLNGLLDVKASSSASDASIQSASKSSEVKRDDVAGSDTDAASDYGADTDVDDDSGADTEDEILKIENRMMNKKVSTNDIVKNKEPPEVRPDTTDLPFPTLPDFFKKKHFFFYGSMPQKERHDLERYITAYGGKVESYMSDDVKYVVTSSKWNKDFDEALCENDNLIFVNPTWILKCHKESKLMPYQPHIIVPELD